MNSIVSNAPELGWLKGGSINGTPEGVDSVDKEYKRTICSIELLDDVLKGDYEAFTACQPEATRLTEESFDSLCDFVTGSLGTEEAEDAMRAFLIINDLGKVEDFVEKIKTTLGFESVDHDKILYQGLRANPELSPTFAGLSRMYRDLIIDGLDIGSMFNMGQFIQCESLPINLWGLKSFCPDSFNFYMIHVLFDIAGAAGHVNSNGSLVCNELYWTKFLWAYKEALSVCTGDKQPLRAYNDYLERTMKFFDVSSLVIAKLCNMIRVSNKEEAQDVEAGFKKISKRAQEVLEKELMASGIGKDTAILLYYAPATFQNAINFYKKEEPKRAIFWATIVVAPILARIYQDVRAKANRKLNYVTAFIGDIAKAAMAPETLVPRFKITKVGLEDYKVMPDF